MKRLSRGAALGVVAGVLFLPAQLAAASAKDLAGIKKRIAREEQKIRQVKKREGAVLQTLGKIDRDLKKKTQDLGAANSKVAAIRMEINKQEVEATRLRLSLDERRELLMRRAIALYRGSRRESSWVGLNGDAPPGVLLQRQRYLATTVFFDHKLVQQLSDEITYQGKLKMALGQKKQELDGERRLVVQLRDSVRKEAESKKLLLTSLKQEKETRVRALKELEQAALRLQKMMDDISRRAVSKPPGAPGGAGLEAMRGKLEWPVRGVVSGGFGKTKHREFATEVFRNGIDIEARLGEEIRAVAQGTVVFANHFAGYGRMVIVDHGERYFSVYAHLSEIFKKSGSVVRRGETLGRIGDSDSQASAKLYFEMRKDGKSIDPLPWFQK
jgi:septal ring factor EnvC (AmiA/AmiB activator)